jgi:diacylglycerol kinase family enzyme/molybdopterin converting factor small subunit
VRLFAALREMAGDRYLDVEGDTVEAVVTRLGDRFGDRFVEVARAGSAVVDGERVGFEHALGEDQEVALLPPVSGGRETGVAELPWPRRPERILLVVNPVARTVSRPVLDVIEKALSADFKLEADETTGRGHATELARRAVADGFDAMVVFSGDGTVNEAVNGLAGSEVALGVIPGGATNVFARVLGVPDDPVEATGLLISRALEGNPRSLHLGKAGDRYFAFNCGIGLDAAAMASVDERHAPSKRSFERRALLAVLRTALFHYAGRKPDLRVTIDEEEPVEGISVLVGRTDPYTFFKRSRVRLTPEASLETGLDVLTVLRLTRRSAPRLARQVFSGKLPTRRDVRYSHDVSGVGVEGASSFPVQVDGDYLGPHEALSISLERNALWVFG